MNLTGVATIDGLRLRKIMGRKEWRVATPHGPDGWQMVHVNGDCSVIVTVSQAEEPHGTGWIHASMTRPDGPPSYEDLKRLHEAAFGDGWAYQVFAPASDHINIHATALHLWGRVDGSAVLPNFGAFGTI